TAARLPATLRPGTYNQTVLAAVAPAQQAANIVDRAARTVTNEHLNAGIGAVADYLGGDKVWIAERDACVVCLALSGHLVGPDGLFDADATFGTHTLDWLPEFCLTGPPRHPNCFPAGVVVSGPGVESTTARWYAGEVVHIRVVGGEVLTVTSNHPILTTQGWVAASSVVEGTKVVRELNLQRMLKSDPGDYQQPMPIEQVAAAFGTAGGVVSERVPITAEDFHGDGRQGYVDVVRPNRVLQGGLHIVQPSGNRAFVAADAELAGVTSKRAGNLLAFGVNPSASSVMSGGGESLTFGRLCPRHAREHGAAAVAQLDARPLQKQRDGATRHVFGSGDGLDALTREVSVNDASRLFRLPSLIGRHPTARSTLSLLSSLLGGQGGVMREDSYGARSDVDTGGQKSVTDSGLASAELIGECLSALAGLVTTDQVVEVRRSPFAGHVYNLETSGGWYSANGFIVHNCRCRLSPWFGHDTEGALSITHDWAGAIAEARTKGDMVAEAAAHKAAEAARQSASFDLPAALRREAERSVLKGWATPSEPNSVRTQAADRLIARIDNRGGYAPSGWRVPKSVKTQTERR
ncbi:MAG: hypothetical protein ACRDTS_23550, partial [Mycobacterium sp.]